MHEYEQNYQSRTWSSDRNECEMLECIESNDNFLKDLAHLLIVDRKFVAFHLNKYVTFPTR